jgi:hypothetical protein
VSGPGTDANTVIIGQVRHAPGVPAVYALVGGRGAAAHVAYVGIAGELRRRLEQHLDRRNSSVTTGESAATLNVDRLTEVRWWEHPRFTDRAALEAAEIVAIDILGPALRSRGATTGAAGAVAADPAIAAEFAALFAGAPSGRLVLPTLQAALDRIDVLEHRLDALAARLEELELRDPRERPS